MSSRPIPDNVLRFVSERIDTVPQMEALLLLWENQTRAWDEDEIGTRIYVTPDAAAEIMRTLQRRQLILAEGANPLRYRYNPVWDRTGDLMAQVATEYRRHLVAMATLIHSKAPSSVREFARAFDLKKER